MSALLKGWSCEVATALSADEALAELEQRQWTPDIVLADYHLGETDTGIMALRELAALDGQKPSNEYFSPAIVITADRTEEVKDEIEAAGAQLLTKPVKPAALRAMINKIIANIRAEK
jgi:CheY-like chemotaxis protein